jgi:argininosuccinate lyase
MLRRILSPAHFIDVRTTPGGPAPVRTTEALAASEEMLARDRAWLTDTRGQLTSSSERLRAEVEAL